MKYSIHFFKVSYPVGYSCEKGNYTKEKIGEAELNLTSLKDIDHEVKQVMIQNKWQDSTHYELFEENGDWLISSYI